MIKASLKQLLVDHTAQLCSEVKMDVSESRNLNVECPQHLSMQANWDQSH